MRPFQFLRRPRRMAARLRFGAMDDRFRLVSRPPAGPAAAVGGLRFIKQ